MYKHISGVLLLKLDIEERVLRLAEYMLEEKTTVRQAAKQFSISKSTVHKDVSDRLRHIDHGLFEEVKAILEINKAERHLRGGFATREKYRALSKPFVSNK